MPPCGCRVGQWNSEGGHCGWQEAHCQTKKTTTSHNKIKIVTKCSHRSDSPGHRRLHVKVFKSSVRLLLSSLTLKSTHFFDYSLTTHTIQHTHTHSLACMQTSVFRSTQGIVNIIRTAVVHPHTYNLQCQQQTEIQTISAPVIFTKYLWVVSGQKHSCCLMTKKKKSYNFFFLELVFVLHFLG